MSSEDEGQPIQGSVSQDEACVPQRALGDQESPRELLEGLQKPIESPKEASVPQGALGDEGSLREPLQGS